MIFAIINLISPLIMKGSACLSHDWLTNNGAMLSLLLIGMASIVIAWIFKHQGDHIFVGFLDAINRLLYSTSDLGRSFFWGEVVWLISGPIVLLCLWLLNVFC